MSSSMWDGRPVAELSAAARTAFMTRVYTRLVGAIALFVAAEWVLFTSGAAAAITELVLQTSWLLILGGLMLSNWLAFSLAQARSSTGQWAGLLLLVAVNAIVFAPLLGIAEMQAPGTVAQAAQYTLVAFVLLSVIAVRSAKDFTWYGAVLRWAALLALAAIVLSVIVGATLGTWFSLAMIGLAGAAILHDTQTILRTTPEGRETAAAMLLFTSVALMLWYVVRLLASRR